MNPDKTETGELCIVRVLDSNDRTVDQDLVALGFVGAEERANNLGTSSTNQPHQSKNFAPLEGKGHVMELAGSQGSNFHQRCADILRTFGVFVFDGSPDHLGDHFIACQIDLGLGIDDLTIAHDGYDIAEVKDLVQLVADVDDRNALFLELMNDLDQLDQLFGRQAAARFVHDDELGLERQRLGDFHHLLFGHAEFGNQFVRVDLAVDSVKQFSGR